MAIATFHSFRGEKSALVLLKANKFQMSASPVYIPKDAVESTIVKGDSIEIPDGFRLAPMVGEGGEARTTEGGEQLYTLVW